MGGSSKKVTVGYKYYLGMHMILCHGPADRVIKIDVDRRPAWAGNNTGGRININNPSLFGGEDREGGISGAVDFETGDPTQGRNDYLQARLGDDIPAFRGVVGAVLRRCYLGLNPYLKPWAFRVQRIFKTTSGEEQWYPSKAGIFSQSSQRVNLCYTVDASGSMLDEVEPGLTRWDIQVEEINDSLDSLKSAGAKLKVGLSIFGDTDEAPITYFRQIDNASDIDYLKEKLSTYPIVVASDTNFADGMLGAQQFFNWAGAGVPIVIFTTDGNPSSVEDGDTAQSITDDAVAIRDEIPDVEVYVINIDLSSTTYSDQLDNTGGAQVVSTNNRGEITDTIAGILSRLFEYDMNPAHIIRECLINKTWGLGYNTADVDDTSFINSADKLFNEGMGISLLWDRQMPIQDFIGEINKHIDGAIFVNRTTGKFVLKLIRDDYNEEDLISLDGSNIAKVSEYSIVDSGDQVNSVTVNFWDRESGEEGSVTADDVALSEAYGVVVNTTVQYPGFTTRSLATRAASRDLRALSSPLLSATLECNREAAVLNIGDAFKFYYPKYHDGYVIMRVNQMSLGDGRNNKVKIVASEDVYALPESGATAEEESGWVEPGGPARVSPNELVFEAPYYEMVQLLGQTEVDNQLGTTPEIGYLQAAAERPEDGISSRIWVDSGNGYEDSGKLDFCPSAKLSSGVGFDDTVFPLHEESDLDQVSVGTHAQLGEELVRIDSLDLTAMEMTVGRGILDTVPSVHSINTPVLFWDEYSDGDQTEYVTGESIDVKLLTGSSQGSLELASAPNNTVVFANRAIRPYRPGDVRAGGFLYPADDWFPNYPVTVTWAHRNRVQETSGTPLEFTGASVTPESGTTYNVLVEALDENKLLLGEVETINGLTGETVDISDTPISNSYPGAIYIRVSVTSLRDGYESWVSPEVIFRGPFREPDQLSATYRTMRPPQNLSAINV